MRAIDLYSGVGGWSCGLQMCGIDVVKSYEIDAHAIATNKLNSAHDCVQCDILKLNLNGLPTDIDLVVGSPPCTQFSFSNRGGGGNLEKGLGHIRKFLEVVDHLKPRWWVMENVPRTINIVRNCFEESGAFFEFSHLKPEYFIAKAELFGTPQRRRRALIGNIDFKALEESEVHEPITLRTVVDSLSNTGRTIQDPVYGISMPKSRVSDLAIEESLDAEERRINASLKTSHHIYNRMSFPENEDAPSRTLTATCTRVSRESIIIQDRRDTNAFRRLSVRERASLQGFPITYEFCATSYGGKIKQIGNAIPPTLSLAVACIVTGRDRSKALEMKRSDERGEIALADRPKEFVFERKRVYPADRRYRFPIDQFNFGSGVRFELTNNGLIKAFPAWECRFWYGTSKRILELPLDKRIVKFLDAELSLKQAGALKILEDTLANFDGFSLQRVWSHRGPADIHPFQLSDLLTEVGMDLEAEVNKVGDLPSDFLPVLLSKFGSDPSYEINPQGKLSKNLNKLIAGFYTFSKFNTLVASSVGNLETNVTSAAL